MSRYAYAAENECGLLYRPGEMVTLEMHYCKLKANHLGNVHSTRHHKHDPGGYEWTVDPEKVELEWPELETSTAVSEPTEK